MRGTFFGGKVRRIVTDCFEDERGLLTPLDFCRYGFTIVRAFTVTGRHGAVRGGHGHRRGRQIVLLVSGQIDFEFRWNGGLERFQLNREDRAILIEPPVWSRQLYRGDHSSLVVFCDTVFDPQDYIREPEE